MAVAVEVELLTGVGSEPFKPSSKIEKDPDNVERPAGTELATSTVKEAVPETAEFNPPIISRYWLPVPTCCHPAVLLTASKEVFSGSVAESATPVAPWFPLF